MRPTLEVERRPMIWLGRLQAGRDLAEGAAQVGTDRSHNGDGGHCDEGSDKPVFDCGNA
jgi:hypothetical protein